MSSGDVDAVSDLAGLPRLAGVGAGFDDVTRTRIFTTVPRRWREIGKAHGEVFSAIRPVTSLVGVRGLLDPKWLVEIEASAYRLD